jgi:Flp pilus assembly protein TadG
LSAKLQNERGQSVAEFALALPLLALLLMAILQFGIVFNNYLTLTDAVRAGARKAAVSRSDPDRKNHVVDTVNTAASDLKTGDVDVQVDSDWGPGDQVTVTGSYPYSINLFGIVLTPPDARFHSKTTERVE